LAGYAPQTLKQTLAKDPVLWQLVLPYEFLSSEDGGGVDDDVVGLPNPLTMATWQEFMKRNEKNNSFTCIAWLCGFCPLANDGGVVVTYFSFDSRLLSIHGVASRFCGHPSASCSLF